MSRGPGRIQRAIVAAFDAEPARRFTTAELIALVYGEEITQSRTRTVQRTLQGLADQGALKKCRAGQLKTGGWRHVWGRA